MMAPLTLSVMARKAAQWLVANSPDANESTSHAPSRKSARPNRTPRACASVAVPATAAARCTASSLGARKRSRSKLRYGSTRSTAASAPTTIAMRAIQSVMERSGGAAAMVGVTGLKGRPTRCRWQSDSDGYIAWGCSGTDRPPRPMTARMGLALMVRHTFTMKQ